MRCRWRPPSARPIRIGWRISPCAVPCRRRWCWASRRCSTDRPWAPVRPERGGVSPSGHSAAAGFGAADLAGKCWEDDPALGAAAYGAAGLTAFSRVQAGEHTADQALAGALIGISFGAASFGIGSEGAAISVGLRF
ncbi:phosphatase PAP2 family protein [Paracoccus sp. NBH48]|uniref:phosphatase PAP2 family protein n=1 Tax=Paracoccus sp. NBH48 TaxID=2596918 RepID=UPI0021044A7E|nr:phosphatase PAP2 family protein [Paracoccus sp. NBH48]